MEPGPCLHERHVLPVLLDSDCRDYGRHQQPDRYSAALIPRITIWPSLVANTIEADFMQFFCSSARILRKKIARGLTNAR